MKVLIFGGSGMLGHKLVQVLGEHFDVFFTLRGRFESVARFGILPQAKCIENVDVTSNVGVRDVIEGLRPDVVINAVGVIKQKPSASDVITTLETNAIFRASRGLRFRTWFPFDHRIDRLRFLGFAGMYREQDVPNLTYMARVSTGAKFPVRTA